MNEDRFKSSLPSTDQYSAKTDLAPDSNCDFEVDDPAIDRVDQLGRYRVDREIARGGMGVIFQAYDELLHRDVAIKLLQYRFHDKPHLCQRFVNEALLTSRLQHPCIVPIYDYGHADDQRPYFAMKLVSGHSLAQLLNLPERSQLDRSRMLKIFEQVCEAIAYAHTQHTLHLDLKPSNVMIGEFGEVHVMDWGLARIWQETAQLTRSNYDNAVHPSGTEVVRVCGTAAYMAPEQARGEPVCSRTDVFGLGALLCEILTGRPPYSGRSHRRVFARALRASMRDALLRLEKSGSDKCLTQLAARCLEPDRLLRPASAQDVATTIGRYLESALEQAESDLCRFFELSLDLFCIANVEGYFERVNSNFSRVLGYTDHELISQPFSDFVHPDDVEATASTLQALTEGHSVISFINRYRCSDGQYIRLEWTARSLPEQGRVFAVARVRSDR